MEKWAGGADQMLGMQLRPHHHRRSAGLSPIPGILTKNRVQFRIFPVRHFVFLVSGGILLALWTHLSLSAALTGIIELNE